MDLPSFDSTAISSLTQRIKSKLESGESAEPGRKKQPAGKLGKKKLTSEAQKSTKRLHGGKSKAFGGKAFSSRDDARSAISNAVPRADDQTKAQHHRKIRVNPAIKELNTEVQDDGKKQRKSLKDPGRKDEAQHTTKKASGKPHALAAPVSVTPAKTEDRGGTHKSSTGPASRTDLEDEIRALGGTEEDLALIDIESESEVEGADLPSSGFQTELQSLANQLGLKDMALEMDNGTSSVESDSKQRSKASSNPARKPSLKPNSKQSTHQSSKESSNPGLDQSSNPNEITLQPRVLRTPRASKFIFEPTSEWHTVELPPIYPDSTKASIPLETTQKLLSYGKELLEEDNTTYAQHVGSSTAHQFYSTIMTSGTLTDKISALTLSVQESPVHNLRALESLVGLAKKRSRAQAVEVLGALKDLFGQGSLLPSDRKLRVFAVQPGLRTVSTIWKPSQTLPKSIEKVHLIAWAFEDWLKAVYFEILKILESWCSDEIAFARGRAVGYVYELLREKPEQEANLLRLLVNKLGDSDKKIASKASYNILQLELSHPMMKPTIISSVESDLLFRPGQSLDAQYYAVITLNQTVLSGREEPVARKVLDIYFTLFLQLLAKPEAKAEVPTKPKITFNRKGQVQGGGSKPGAKSLSKVAKSVVSEEMREKILSAVLTGVNRALPYTQAEDGFLDKHLDTLFRVTHSSNFNTSIQALMLIQQLSGSHQAASDRFYRTLYESLTDPRLLTTSKQALYLNLLFRALRADLKIKRVKAFAKRLVQIASMHQPSLACGILYLLRELEGIFPDLKALYYQAEEDESDEVFQDVDEDRAIIAQTHSATLHEYDGRKRDPEFSRAERSCLWEIEPILTHFHPSVALFAQKLLANQAMPPKPDLSSNTLRHFLDRFVYRNPKKAGNTTRGSSIMQPLASTETSHLLVSAGGRHTTKTPLNSESFWQMNGGNVAADEVFFHKYFNAIGKGKEKKVTKKLVENEDEDEDEIWNALVDSKPELEGDSDDDIAMSDLESAFEDDEESAANGSDIQSLSDLDLDEDDAELQSEDEIPSNLETGLEEGMEAKSERRAKRRKLKSLPTFASVEDYAAMLEGET